MTLVEEMQALNALQRYWIARLLSLLHSNSYEHHIAMKSPPSFPFLSQYVFSSTPASRARTVARRSAFRGVHVPVQAIPAYVPTALKTAMSTIFEVFP